MVHGLKKISLFVNQDKSLDSKKICIIGSGFLGLMMTEIIRNKLNFSEIHVIDRNKFKLNQLPESANIIKHCLDSSSNWENFLKNPNHKFDYVVEITGCNLNFSRSIEICSPNANLLWIGNIQKDLLLKKNIVSNILRKEIKVSGSWNSNFKHQDDDWIDSIELIKSKNVEPSNYITKLLSLEDAPFFLEKMYKHKTRSIRHPYIKYCISNIQTN